MHWKQVCVIAQAFAATKPSATWSKLEPVFSIYAQAEPDSDALLSLDSARRFQHLQPRLQVLPKFKDFASEGAWVVRQTGVRAGAHSYLAPVKTAEALRDALERAWDRPGRAGVCKVIMRTVEDGGDEARRLMLMA